VTRLAQSGIIRFNFLQPPFNQEKMRQALLYVIDQRDYVLSIAGDPKYLHPCYSFFSCGTTFSSEIVQSRSKASETSTRQKADPRVGLQG
jgi:ABC-type oligopeptide transport system substrate-binding subunit